MARGRPRKPDALKILEGNPGKGPLNHAAPVPEGTLERPAYVTDYAAEVWEQITTSMPQELYSRTDSIALATFCVAASQFRDATETLQREGLTATTDKGNLIVHPAMHAQSRAVQTMAMLSSRLGLDPVSRASMRMPRLKKETSKFEGLLNEPIYPPGMDSVASVEATA